MKIRWLVLLVVVAFVSSCSNGDAGSASEPRSTSMESRPSLTGPLPSSEAGMRWQGAGRVVVAVADDWSTDTGPCKTSNGSAVWYPRTSDDGPGPDCADRQQDATLKIGSTDDPGARDLDRTLTQALGTTILYSEPRCEESRPPRCTFAFKASGTDEVFVLHTTSIDDPNPLIDRLRRSLRVLPPGYTTVPQIPYDSTEAEARAVLIQAGVSVGEIGELPRTSDGVGHFNAVRSEPITGTPIKLGAAVDLYDADR